MSEKYLGMKYFVVILFFTTLSVVNIQAANTAKNPQHTEDIPVPVHYQSIEGTLMGKTFNARPCIRGNNAQNVPNVEQNAQTVSQVETPAPSRRFLVSEPMAKPVNNVEYSGPQPLLVYRNNEPNVLPPVNSVEDTLVVNNINDGSKYPSSVVPNNFERRDVVKDPVTPPPVLKVENEERINYDKPATPPALPQMVPKINLCSEKASRRFGGEKNNSGEELSNNQENQSYIPGKNVPSLNVNSNDNTGLKVDKQEQPSDLKVSRSGDAVLRSGDNQQYDPTKAVGVEQLKGTKLLMDYDRICYACSSANDPTCLKPDRRTSVKFCRKGDRACITKTFGKGSTSTTIRDCANSCYDSTTSLAPHYKSCSICHADLCNGSISINANSLIFTLSIFIMVVTTKSLL